MNFYTFFKKRTKEFYDFVTSNNDYAQILKTFKSYRSLNSYRCYLLKLCFGYSNLRNFSVAVFRSVPCDLPYSVYYDLFLSLFETDVYLKTSDTYDLVSLYSKKLFQTYKDIMES